MRTLRDLLTTWENWSARQTSRNALGTAPDETQRQRLLDSIDRAPQVEALDALADVTELVSLLTGWRWQAVHEARTEGASWSQIGTAVGVSAEHARADYLATIERMERAGVGETEIYRRSL